MMWIGVGSMGGRLFTDKLVFLVVGRSRCLVA